MKTFICQICGDAYLGEEKPKNCPFCGAREIYIKEGKEANPVVNMTSELNQISVNNLKETLDLEMRANAIYLCMVSKTNSYEVMKMYKRLAKVELEHAIICTKLLKIEMPENISESCAKEDMENFQKTLELENHAANFYQEFAKSSPEQHIKIMFTALNQVEQDHIALIKNYLS